MAPATKSAERSVAVVVATLSLKLSRLVGEDNEVTLKLSELIMLPLIIPIALSSVALTMYCLLDPSKSR